MPSPDDDKTVIPHAPGSTGGPGDFVSSSSFFGHTLPEGTRIAEFVIKGLIGEGGFGIVYLAYDPSLQRHVALKEYMPASLAGRANGGLDVVVKSERHRDTFKAGLKSFVNEARLLARFDHRSLVKVYRFWEDHGTAYMVMPFYEGPTLKRALAERAEPPDEAALRAWLDPLLDALAVMHEAHCFHRDIAPDNILLTPNGPLLLDFGAARRVIGDMTQALTVMLKPGYAPIEQYGEVAAMAQGAWTDLYALASVVHCAITGQAPMSSVERLMSDTLVPLRVRAAGRYSEHFLRAVDAALALRPKDRPQDVAQWRAMLDAPAPKPPVAKVHAPAPAPAAPAPAVVAAKPPAPLTPAPAPRPVPPAPAAPLHAPAPVPTMHIPVLDVEPTAPAPALPDEFAWSPDDAPARRPAPRHGLRLLGAAVVLAALAATPLLFTMQGDDEATADTSAAPAAAPAAAVEPTPPLAENPPAVAPAAEAAPAPAPAVEPAPSTSTVESPAPVPSTVPTAPAPIAMPAPATAPAPAPRAEPAERERPAPAAAPRAAARPPPKPAVEKPEEAPARATNSPPRSEAVSSKCSDILQKASLEALTAEETAYLRKECR